MNIVIFGHVCLDRNISEHSTYIGPGSPAMFMNRIFQQLPGCQTAVVASYGPDYLPYLSKVSRYPVKPNINKTLIYENKMNLGIRTQKAYNRQEALFVSISPALAAIIHRADLIFFAPLLPNPSARYFQQVNSLAPKQALKFLLPQGYYRDFDSNDRVVCRNFIEADKILPWVDFVITSDQDGPQMIDRANHFTKKYALNWIVTQAEKGAVAISKNKVVALKTVAVPAAAIIDSVGCGDVFAAAFAYQYKKTGKIKAAGNFANKLSRQRLLSKAWRII